MHHELINATQEERAEWQRRYAAVDAALRQTEALLTDPQVTFTRKATIAGVVKQLRAFGEKQFAFFDEGFHRPDPFFTLSDDPLQGVAAQYVFGTIIDQIAHDSSVLDQIEMQRRDQRYAATLAVADRVAYDALGYVSHLLNTPSTVLTYLQKSPDARVIPYAPVALIGIPRTCHPLQATSPQGVVRDLLAIPHELGHHLYWNGHEAEDSGKQLRHQPPINRLQPDKPAWLAAWFEEIFADVVTCVIGGPLAALSMQELQLQARNDWLLVDNGVHPVAAFRTYIYLVALEAMGMPTAAAKLTARWHKKLTDRALVSPGRDPLDYLCFLPSTNEAPLTFRAALERMRTLIVALVHLFQSGAASADRNTLSACAGVQPSNNGRSPWSADLSADADLTNDAEVEALYQQFEQCVLDTFTDGQTTSNQQIDSKLDPYWKPENWLELVAQRGVTFEIAEEVVNRRRLPSSQFVIDQISRWYSREPQDPKDIPLEFAEWIKILEFAGWSTEGPTDGNLSGG